VCESVYQARLSESVDEFWHFLVTSYSSEAIFGSQQIGAAPALSVSPRTSPNTRFDPSSETPKATTIISLANAIPSTNTAAKVVSLKRRSANAATCSRVESSRRSCDSRNSSSHRSHRELYQPRQRSRDTKLVEPFLRARQLASHFRIGGFRKLPEVLPRHQQNELAAGGAKWRPTFRALLAFVEHFRSVTDMTVSAVRKLQVWCPRKNIFRRRNRHSFNYSADNFRS
jgi:hypothetical protein